MGIYYDHVALAVTDLETSSRFYRDVVGLQHSSTRRLKDGRDQAVFYVGSEILVLFDHEDKRYREKVRKPRSGVHHLAFGMEAEQFDAILERCKANGVEIRRLEKNLGARGEGYAAYFYDPDGNEVEIKKYEDDPNFRNYSVPDYHV